MDVYSMWEQNSGKIVNWYFKNQFVTKFVYRYFVISARQ